MSQVITNTANGTYTQPPTTTSKNESIKSEVEVSKPTASQSDTPQDKLEISGETVAEKPLTYSKPNTSSTKLSPGEIDSLLAESERKSQEFLNLIRGLITKQGLDFSKVVRGEQKLTIEDPKTIEDAKAAIAIDGEYGIKKTAENILNFAKNLMNADPSKMELIRNSIKQGFEAAKGILGGELPDISKKTYDVIMKELDRWEKDGIPTEDVNVTVE